MNSEEPHPQKKHPCHDCTFCQWCSDDRCRRCLARGPVRQKLSLEEQIARYEQLNAAAPLPADQLGNQNDEVNPTSEHPAEGQ